MDCISCTAHLFFSAYGYRFFESTGQRVNEFLGDAVFLG